ncbi:MAG TPA: GNAT family N-acetyltransferase [Candidatus Deferrimicrobium sp.]|nr:GNAT family N-acetyltransferase [Candidatus Deferrimicrobium sp.]
MEVDLVAASASAWGAFLRDVEHDIYHLPGYVALSAALEEPREHPEARAIVARDGDRAMLLPVVIRDVPGEDGLRDAVSPYGYPGPLFQGDVDTTFVADASAAIVARLRDEGVISLFVRTHPLINRELGGLATIGTIVEHGETVSIDLTASTEAIWSATQSGHRNEINRAIRAGARARLDPDWAHEAAFVELYRATMHRLGASVRYLFGPDYVRSLRAVLGPRLHLCVVDIDGAIAAAGLFTETCGIVQYHLSGSDPAFARQYPTKLMLHYVRGLMKERNDRVLHLGGGLQGEEDSLFRFKAGFSNQRQPFRTWRVVVDPDRYATLVRATYPTADPADTSGFFPLYRRGVA